MPEDLASAAPKRFFRRLGQWLFHVQEWSAVDRAMVPLLLLVMVIAHHMLWWSNALYRPNGVQLVQMAYTQQIVQLEGWFVLLIGLLLALGLWLRQRQPNAIWYQHLSANTYALVLCAAGYAAGSLNFASGVVLMGAPMVGFILMEPQVVKRAFAIALLAMVGFGLASAYGWLPYAPIMQPPVHQEARLFWTDSLLSFALPHLIPNSLLIALMVYRWKQREATAMRLSLTDPLTQVHNRRSMLQLLDKELARVQRHGTSLGVVLLDVDHFKSVNDRFGHPVGDRVLQHVAQVLSGGLRQCDAMGRFGGEEFLLLLPDTPAHGTMVLAERCRQRLQGGRIPLDEKQDLTVTASFGVLAVEPGSTLKSDQVLHWVDAALYQAKSSGRNRCETIDIPESALPLRLPPQRAQWFTNEGVAVLPVLSQWGIWQGLQQVWLRLRYPAAWLRQVLEWSVLQRLSLVMGLHTLVLCWYGLWLLVMLWLPDAAQRLNLGLAQQVLPYLLGSISLSVLLMASSYKLSQRRARCLPMEVLALVYLGMSLMGCAHLVGILSLLSGVNITCIPMLGLILFGPTLIGAVSTLCLALIVLSAYTAALGLWPYAPLLTPAPQMDYQLKAPFWVASVYALSLPTMLVSFWLAEHVLGHWRDREARLQALSRTDELTGLPNRLRIQQVLTTEVARTLRHGPPMAVVIVDLDHFKSINDRWGHSTGDAVLRAAARALASQVRACDVVGRYGGEEFMLVLPDTTLEGALVLMERCRSGLEQLVVLNGRGERVPVSGSIGVASNESCLSLSVQTLVQSADEALYRAKTQGRNQVQANRPTANLPEPHWSLAT